ncbi:MAG: PP2C family protein-serine/threonine phosphatase, partial [Streptomycetales bacterium]
MTFSLRFAARSDVGLLRDGNEDSGYAGPRLLAVADGMGGQAAGEVASSVVIAAIARLDDEVPDSEVLDSLARAVEAANDHLRDMVEQNPRLEGMGTTLTALLWAGSRLGLVHVGDSRGYLLRDGALRQMTHDHTWVQRLVDEGRLTEEEADHHPQRSLIMRAIDGRGNVDLDLSVRDVRPGDRYLLCSDGLSGVVSHETLAETLAKGDPEWAVDALIELALRAGGPDNITCVVADVVDIAATDALPSNIPQVVGAAADQRRSRSSSTHDSAAGRASELGRQRGREDGPGYPRGGRGGAWIKRVLGVALLAALLGGSAYWAYRWSQSQYYVGADTGKVTIYQGLNQRVAGVSMSEVYERQDVGVPSLPQADRENVKDTIAARNLDDARRIVDRLRRHAECAQQPTPAATRPQAGGGTADARDAKPA